MLIRLLLLLNCNMPLIIQVIHMRGLMVECEVCELVHERKPERIDPVITKS